jgi:hypothetical protein
MPESPGLSFLILLIFWVSYFLIIFFVSHNWYLRLRGEPPKTSGTVIVNGKKVSAMEAWETNTQRLKKKFIRWSLAAAILPLLFPIIAKLLF